MMDTVLIADDDEELAMLLQQYLGQHGLKVILAHDGPGALDQARSKAPDALVLDIMMPGMDGIEVLKQLRKESSLPVIMLTARGDDLDRIIGLELGADDYLPKPCNPRELLARIRAILRRSGITPGPELLSVDDLTLNAAARQLLKDGQPMDLTSTEFTLAQVLLQRAGQVVSKRELYLAALGREPVRFDRSIDMHMSNLRRKLGMAPDGDRRIETVRGLGYLYRLTGNTSA